MDTEGIRSTVPESCGDAQPGMRTSLNADSVRTRKAFGFPIAVNYLACSINWRLKALSPARGRWSMGVRSVEASAVRRLRFGIEHRESRLASDGRRPIPQRERGDAGSAIAPRLAIPTA